MPLDTDYRPQEKLVGKCPFCGGPSERLSSGLHLACEACCEAAAEALGYRRGVWEDGKTIGPDTIHTKTLTRMGLQEMIDAIFAPEAGPKLRAVEIKRRRAQRARQMAS